jgi:hypothetical protein
MPEAVSVSYSPSGNTNQPVEVTLTISEPVQSIPGRTGSGTTWTKTYTGNVSESVTFYDLVGNAGSTGIVITRIDTSAVTGSISYAPSTATSGDVLATIVFNKTGVTITNNSGSDEYEFTGNGTFTFEFVDSYGNTGSEEAVVNWIDKINPEALSVIYSPSTSTNGIVTVTLTVSEAVQSIS